MYFYCYLEEDEYKVWKEIYFEVIISFVNCQEQIENVVEIIEQDYELVGVIVIEDKFQQGVFEIIDKFC